MPSVISKNDKAWNKIFEERGLLAEITRHGFVYITSQNLNQVGEREARLLAKQDTKKGRPQIFRDNNLSILPIENGKYAIFKDPETKTYFTISHLVADIEVEEYHIKTDFGEFDTINSEIISTESQAIDYAYLVSLIKTVTREPELLQTIRGRYRSENFSIRIPQINQTLNISGVQIEIDAGFESPNKIFLFEAKQGVPDDFNIRQLLFPFKDWSSKTRKEIVPIFFVYTNGLYYFLQFRFQDEYGNLELVQKRCFTINEPIKQSINLHRLLDTIQMGTEPQVTFPQANDLNKVIDIITNFAAGVTSKSEITELFNFEGRQSDYYADAAIYLGLLKRHTARRSEFELTPEGEFVAKSQKRSQRNLFLLKQLIKTPCFNEILHLFIEKEYDVSNMNSELISLIIKKYHNLSGTTPGRRSSTVKRWLHWMMDNIDFE